MEKLKKFLSPRRFTLFLGVLVLIISISFINEPAQSQTQGIVTYMALDVVDDKIELACSVLAPSSGQNAKANIYKATARTLAEAVGAMGLQLGKDLGFAQCDVVAVGENLLNENLINVFDYFTRTKKIGRNILLLAFDGKVDEFVQAIIYLDEEKSLNLSEILTYNREYLLGIDSSLENFYLGYYGKTGISLLPKLKLTEEETNLGVQVEISGAENEGSGSKESAGLDESKSSSSSSNSGKKKMFLTNDGTTSILKNGKKFAELTPEDTKMLNLYLTKAKYGSFTVEDVTDEYYNNAVVVLSLEDKDVNIDYKFKDEKPIVRVKLHLYVKLDEIEEENKNKKLLRRDDELLTKAVADKLKSLAQDELETIFKKQQNLKADCLNIYSYFEKFQAKKWKNYLNSISDSEDFLSNIMLETDIEISQKS